MKYIVIRIDKEEIAFVFPNFIQHIDFAVEIISRHELNGSIVGAGFVVFKDEKFSCYGRSISLNIKSREKMDTKIINDTFSKTLFLAISKAKQEEDVFFFY